MFFYNSGGRDIDYRFSIGIFRRLSDDRRMMVIGIRLRGLSDPNGMRLTLEVNRVILRLTGGFSRVTRMICRALYGTFRSRAGV